MKALKTVAYAAERLGVTRATVYNAIRRGYLPCVWVGGLVRLDADALELWIASGGQRQNGSEHNLEERRVVVMRNVASLLSARQTEAADYLGLAAAEEE